MKFRPLTLRRLQIVLQTFEQRSYSVMASSKPKVFVTRNVPQAAIELLSERCQVSQWKNDTPIPRDVLKQEIQEVDALFCLLTEKIDEELLSEGLKLGYTPDVLTEATAELTVALLLCTARRLIEANSEVYKLNASTSNLFSREAFQKMKPDAIFVNTSRMNSHKQKIAKKLSERRSYKHGHYIHARPQKMVNETGWTLKRYSESPNFGHLPILPHIGSATDATRTRMATLTAENILAGLENREMPAPIPE